MPLNISSRVESPHDLVVLRDIKDPFYMLMIFDIMKRSVRIFTGECREEVEEFLSSVNDYRAMCPLSDTDLLTFVRFFMKKEALLWFKIRRPIMTNWQDFEITFRRRFGDQRHQTILQDNVLAQNHGYSEDGNFI